MLTERDITLIRVALMLRMDRIKQRIEEGTGLRIEKDHAEYVEHKALLQKLWDMRKALPKEVETKKAVAEAALAGTLLRDEKPSYETALRECLWDFETMVRSELDGSNKAGQHMHDHDIKGQWFKLVTDARNLLNREDNSYWRKD